jgi:hypothetical protein
LSRAFRYTWACPRGPKAKTFREGARNGLRLTVTNNTCLLYRTVSATQETATPLLALRLRPKYRCTVNHTWPHPISDRMDLLAISPSILVMSPNLLVIGRTRYIRILFYYYVFSSSRSILYYYLVTTSSTLHFIVHL